MLVMSPEQPAPVRQIADLLAGWIGRLGPVWVEGQITELNHRGSYCYLVLRDPSADVSIPASAPGAIIGGAEVKVGDRVVINGRISYWTKNGRLSLQIKQIRHVGIGELLARLEHLKQVLATEGLFAAERKKPLPFLPNMVGLITGRASAAERDVHENARRRWPAVRFRTVEVAVQGPGAAAEVTTALRDLDHDPEVSVIIIARGGGAVEDLLPFSDEGLCRAVAACATPVVSAIGHEQDSPILDLVADLRASTPTDAAKLIVPDLAAERAGLDAARRRLSGGVRGLFARERALIDSLRSRPVMARPTQVLIAPQRELIAAARDRARRSMRVLLDTNRQQLGHLATQLRAVSPGATLDRGYAVVTLADHAVVRDPAQVPPGTPIQIEVAAGSFAAQSIATES